MRANLADKFAGKTIQCPDCRSPIVVPVARGDVRLPDPESEPLVNEPPDHDLEPPPVRHEAPAVPRYDPPATPPWFYRTCELCASVLAVSALGLQGIVIMATLKALVEAAADKQGGLAAAMTLFSLALQFLGVLGTLLGWTLVLVLLDSARRLRRMELER